MIGTIGTLCPFKNSEFVLGGDLGAEAIQGYPESLAQRIMEVSQGVKDMKVLHAEILGSTFKAKLLGAYIDLFALPANARLVECDVQQKDEWPGIGVDPAVLSGKICNSLSDTAFDRTGVDNTTVDLATPELKGVGKIWHKESVPTTVKLKLGVNAAFINDDDVIEVHAYYVQE